MIINFLVQLTTLQSLTNSTTNTYCFNPSYHTFGENCLPNLWGCLKYASNSTGDCIECNYKYELVKIDKSANGGEHDLKDHGKTPEDFPRDYCKLNIDYVCFMTLLFVAITILINLFQKYCPANIVYKIISQVCFWCKKCCKIEKVVGKCSKWFNKENKARTEMEMKKSCQQQPKDNLEIPADHKTYNRAYDRTEGDHININIQK